MHRFALIALLSVLAAAGCTKSKRASEEDVGIGFMNRQDTGPGDLDGGLSDVLTDTAPVDQAGAIGAPCGGDADCDGGAFCIAADPNFPDGYCTAGCASESDCPEGSVCLGVSRTEAYCFKRCDSSAPERSCRAGYGCASSIDLPADICLAGCSDDTDCSEGRSCDPRGGDFQEGSCFDPSAMPGQACVDGTECPSGGFCVDEPQYGWPEGTCISTGCDPVSGNGCAEGTRCVPSQGSGICLPACSTSEDCRGGYGCTGESPQVCVPGCTVDSECTGGRVCNPALGTCDLPFDAARLGQSCDFRTGAGCEGGECLSSFFSGFPGAYCAYAGCNPEVSGACPGDGVCLPTPDGTGMCLDGCASVSDCRPGYACELSDADLADSPKYCAPSCTADAQCGNPRLICNEGTGLCSFEFDPDNQGAACDPDDFFGCFGGRCLSQAEDGFPGNMCVAIGCRNAGDGPEEPCPSGSHCADDGAGDPEIGYCLPACTAGASTGCRSGYACQAVGVGGATVCSPS